MSAPAPAHALALALGLAGLQNGLRPAKLARVHIRRNAARPQGIANGVPRAFLEFVGAVLALEVAGDHRKIIHLVVKKRAFLYIRAI